METNEQVRNLKDYKGLYSNLNEEKINPVLHQYFRRNMLGLWIKHELLNIHLTDDPNQETERNSTINNLFSNRLKEYKNYQEKNNYEGMWELISRPFVMDWFIRNYKKIYKYVGEEKYYQMLGYTVTDIDYEDYIGQYQKLISIGKNPKLMMTDEDKLEYDQLPEIIRIYRGCSTTKKNITSKVIKELNGPSWTTNKKVGLWFSDVSTHSSQSILLTCEILKDDVQSYFTGRKESEVFLNYKEMNISKINWEFVEGFQE